MNLPMEAKHPLVGEKEVLSCFGKKKKVECIFALIIIIIAIMGLYSFLDGYFQLTARGTDVATEFRAGTASFFTLSYLLLVNPQLLTDAGVSHDDAVVATALSAAVSCFIVGVFANLPFGCAPGLGLSSYLSYSLVQAGLTTLEEALTACWASGILLLIVALTGITHFLMKVVPECVKYGIVVGMGLLIAMIGMVSVHLIVPDEKTIVGLGDLTNSPLQLTLFGLILVASLLYWDVKGGILLGIAVVSVMEWCFSQSWPTKIATLPEFHNNHYIVPTVLFGENAPILWTAVGAFLLICTFDISGVVFGLATLGGLIDREGRIPGSLWVFLASSAGTVTASFFGSTPIICCVETASGIKEGGRTGLTSVIIGLYFVLSLFLSPLFGAVPSDATAPVLMLVGVSTVLQSCGSKPCTLFSLHAFKNMQVMMMSESAKVNWHSMDQALPAFLTAVLMPLTYDITNGMIFGLSASLCFYVTTGAVVGDVRSLLAKCCGSGGMSHREEYEEIEQEALLEEGDDDNGEFGEGGLLLSTGMESASARRTIERAKKEYLNGSERNVAPNAVLY
jgi:AGZA family xanthine/uracil permease-like MFS transporter